MDWRWIMHVLERHVTGGEDRSCVYLRSEYWPSIKRINFSTVHWGSTQGLSRAFYRIHWWKLPVHSGQDARPHTAGLVYQYLQEVDVPVMERPALSPDLHPIENSLDGLKKRVRARDIDPTSRSCNRRSRWNGKRYLKIWWKLWWNQWNIEYKLSFRLERGYFLLIKMFFADFHVLIRFLPPISMLTNSQNTCTSDVDPKNPFVVSLARYKYKKGTTG